VPEGTGPRRRVRSPRTGLLRAGAGAPEPALLGDHVSWPACPLRAAKAAVGAREVPRRHHATLRLPRFRVERVIHHSRGEARSASDRWNRIRNHRDSRHHPVGRLDLLFPAAGVETNSAGPGGLPARPTEVGSRSVHPAHARQAAQPRCRSWLIRLDGRAGARLVPTRRRDLPMSAHQRHRATAKHVSGHSLNFAST
jgi:hypothetical protein